MDNVLDKLLVDAIEQGAEISVSVKDKAGNVLVENTALSDEQKENLKGLILEDADRAVSRH